MNTHFFTKRLTIAAGLLSLTTPLLADVVYVANPEANAIYFRDTEDGPGTPTLLSGNTSVQSNEFSWLNLNEAIFQPLGEDTAILYDASAGNLTQIYTPPGGHAIAAIAAGPGPNEAAIVTYQRSARTAHIVEGTRPGPGGSWTWTIRKSIAADAGTKHFTHFDVLKLATDRFAVCLNGTAPNGVFYVNATLPGTPVPSPDTTKTYRLFRGANGGFIADPSKYGSTDPIRFFDASGTQVASYNRSDAGNFNSRPTALEWNAAAPFIRSISRFGLQEGTDPLAPPIAASTIYEFIVGGAAVPARDYSGAESFFTSGTLWSLYNNALGIPVQIDTSTEIVSPRFVLEAGYGPPFKDIADIAMGPSGELYVLDNVTESARILEVDKQTGDRTIVAEVTRKSEYQPRLAVLPSGEFLLARFLMMPVTGSIQTDEFGIRFERVTPSTPDPAVDTFSETASSVSLLEWELNSAGEVTLLPEQSMYPSLYTLGDGTVDAAPNSSSSSNVFTNIDLYHNQATITCPGFATPTDQVSFQFLNSGSGDIRAVIRSVTSPSSQVFQVAQSELFHPSLSGPSSSALTNAVIQLPASSNLAGNWTLELYGSSITPLEVSMTPLYGKGATDLAIDSLDRVWLYRPHPGLLMRKNPAAETVESIINLTPQSVGIDVSKLSAFQAATTATEVFAASIVEPKVLRVNLSTGQVAPFITGLPAGLDAELLGIPGASASRLAVDASPITAAVPPARWTLYE